MQGHILIQRLRGRLAGRRVVAVGVLTLIALMLSACVEVNQSSTIKQDFTGTTNMRVGISLQALALVNTIPNSLGTTNPRTPAARATPAASTDPFADLKTQVAQLGGTAKDYKSDKFQGVDTTFQFKTLDEMTTQINTVLAGNSSLSNPSGTTGTTGSSSSSSSDIAKLTATSTGKGVRIAGHVDPLSSLNSPSNATVTGGFDPKVFGTDGYVQLSFTMPGKITSKDALAKTDKSTVTWNFKAGDPAADIFVESDTSGGQAGNIANAPAGATPQPGATTGGGSPIATTRSNAGSSHTGLIIGILIAAIVVLGGVGLLFGLRGRGNKRPAPAAATGPAEFPSSPYTHAPGAHGGPQQHGAPSPYGQQPYGGQPPHQPQQSQPPYGGYPPQPGQPPHPLGAYGPPQQQQPQPPQQPQQPPYSGGYSQPPQSGPYGSPQQPPYPSGYGQPPQGQPPQQGGYPPQYAPPGGPGQPHGGQYPPRGPEPPR